MKRLATLILLILFMTSAVQAGQVCSDKLPQPENVQKAFRLAMNTRQQLDASGAQVALVARVGQDLSRYRLRYSHLALAWRDHPAGRWLVVHELNDCGTANSSLFNEGLANFFLDDMDAFEALVVIPSEVLQEKIVARLAQPEIALSFHEERYNMLAYPFSTQYQNSNQWLLEFLAEPLADSPLPDRQSAQDWLRSVGFLPTTLDLPASTRLGARMFRANIAFDDQPSERRWEGKIDTVSVESVVAFLKRKDPGLRQQLVTLSGGRIVQGGIQVAQQPEIRIGDRWSYRIIDNLTGETRGTETVSVYEITANEIRQKAILKNTQVYSRLEFLDRQLNVMDNGSSQWTPGNGNFQFPLKIGKEWNQIFEARTFANDRRTRHHLTARVTGIEKIRVPAGEFDTYKIECSIQNQPDNDRTRFTSDTRVTRWYSPQVKQIVKEESETIMAGRTREKISKMLNEYTVR